MEVAFTIEFRGEVFQLEGKGRGLRATPSFAKAGLPRDLLEESSVLEFFPKVRFAGSDEQSKDEQDLTFLILNGARVTSASVEFSLS